jgi:formate dehydrogenase iron-sulfur subunit
MAVHVPAPAEGPAAASGYDTPPPRKGFFTDTSICIGCKACEVACKEWNLVPEDGLDLLGLSYDNTGHLSASTWRHVAFVEQRVQQGHQESGAPAADGDGAERAPSIADIAARGVLPVDPATAASPVDGVRHTGLSTGGSRTGGTSTVDLGMPSLTKPGDTGTADGRSEVRWLMASDVCKHCTHAGCLDVCPTGSLFRTEFGTVVVQEDICNGCGYCVSACPYGVIGRREEDGRAWKCTLCYDRIGDGLQPACAQACPTQSIQYGDLDELRERARGRVEQLHDLGVPDARLYGDDPDDGVGGAGAFFLLLDEPEVYGLPPDPVVPTRDLQAMWRRAGVGAALLALATVGAFVRSPR